MAKRYENIFQTHSLFLIFIVLFAFLSTIAVLFLSNNSQDIRSRASNQGNLTKEEKFIDQYYRVLLGRYEPTTSTNFTQWVTYLKNSNCSTTLKLFITSPEFSNRIKGLSDTEYITMIYQAALSRDPEPNGFQHHLDMLKAGTSRSELFTKFLQNPEVASVCQAGNTYSQAMSTPLGNTNPPVQSVTKSVFNKLCVNTHFLSQKDQFGTYQEFTNYVDQVLSYFANNDIHCARETLQWLAVEKNPHVYDFSQYDDLFAHYRKYGFSVSLIVVDTPVFYSSNPSASNYHIFAPKPENYPDFKNFFATLFSHLANVNYAMNTSVVKQIEFLNEPDWDDYFQTTTKDEYDRASKYYGLLSMLYQVKTQTNSPVKILNGAFMRHNLGANGSVFVKSFFAFIKQYSNGIPPYDIFNFHLYNEINTQEQSYNNNFFPISPENEVNRIEQYLRSTGVVFKPWNISETNSVIIGNDSIPKDAKLSAYNKALTNAKAWLTALESNSNTLSVTWFLYRNWITDLSGSQFRTLGFIENKSTFTPTKLMDQLKIN